MSPLLLLSLLLLATGQTCTYNTDCSVGQSCEERTCYSAIRDLYQPCTQRYTCGAGLQCLAGRCYHSPATLNEPCVVDVQCAGGLACDGEYGVCKERNYESL
jgi:hypothetical protein